MCFHPSQTAYTSTNALNASTLPCHLSGGIPGGDGAEPLGVSETMQEKEADTAGEVDQNDVLKEPLSKEKGLKRPLQDLVWGSSSKRPGKESFTRGSTSETLSGCEAVDSLPSSSSSLLWVEMGTVALGNDGRPHHQPSDPSWMEPRVVQSSGASSREASMEDPPEDIRSDYRFEGLSTMPPYANCSSNFDTHGNVPDMNLRARYVIDHILCLWMSVNCKVNLGLRNFEVMYFACASKVHHPPYMIK